MFTGIIEAFGTITQLVKEEENVHISLESPLTHELKIDQSVAHNGVCLTVVKIDGNEYTVTAIKETIDKTNLSTWCVDDKVNLERAMQLGARLDGHIVQGHVDQIEIRTGVKEEGGSVLISNTIQVLKTLPLKRVNYRKRTSLTVVNSGINIFFVAIIPFTYEHTNFQAHTFKVGVGEFRV